MAKRGPKPDRPEGPRTQRLELRLTDLELEQIDKLAKHRGVDRSEAIRSCATISAERDHLMRGVLETHVRGRFTEDEIGVLLEAMNGCAHEVYLDHYPAMLGAGMAREIADAHLDEKWDIDGDKLAHRIHDLPPVAKAALDLWCADMWRHCEDDWSGEIAWLAGETSACIDR